ncbi:MAG TPA: twin-arginine translocation signal domain-containing protein, partial [Cyclobacteriaceae bacterium]
MVELPKIIPQNQQIQRRNFLKGAGALLAGIVGTGCSPSDPFTTEAKKEQVKPSGEMVKLLSTTGEIIEVDK